MITFIISLAVLILGYLFYGRFVERVFGHLFEYSFSFIARFKNVKNNNDYNYR
jgi:hypothetical protein